MPKRSAVQLREVVPMGSQEQVAVWERLDDVIMGGNSSSQVEYAPEEGPTVSRWKGDLVLEVWHSLSLSPLLTPGHTRLATALHAAATTSLACDWPLLFTPWQFSQLCSPAPWPLQPLTPPAPSATPKPHPTIPAPGPCRFLHPPCTQGGGFCGTRTKALDACDLSGYDGIALRVKGDGQIFKLNIKTLDQLGSPESTYQTTFDTVAGQWSEVLLPWDNFVSVKRAQSDPKVERNAIIGDDAEARKRDIPIVQLNPGGTLNH
ncbi:uncharacterized protein HaLaN_11023, partial [Haematococcus lacustris]